ncbi:MAG: LLM class flavin-dependent oxidoreductase [Chloroflexi bacterium]|nr:LLM class flavin-dependent oxidoreductase [Chloroflexota bacterium]
MEKPYLRIWDLPGSRAEKLALAQEVERRGFPGVWSPSRGDNIAFLLAVLERTDRISVATGIAHIYLRHPHLMAQAGSLIEELHPGRLMLGLGVSHQPTHAELGLSVGRPLSDMREYVAEMRANTEGAAFPRLVLATLRRRMTVLAAEIADGALWANGLRSRMATSLAAIPRERRDDFFVGTFIPTAVDENRAAALAAARDKLFLYFSRPYYQAYFEEAGYHDEVAAARAAVAAGDDEARLAAISERFIADACLVGTASEVREQAEAWAAEGVTLVLAPAPDDRAGIERALAVFG